VPRAKLLVSDRRLQKQRSQPQQTGLDSIPDEDFFCGLEIKHGRNTTARPKLSVSEKITVAKASKAKQKKKNLS
jgi:hypothetical protein